MIGARLPERRRGIQFVRGVGDVDAFARAVVGDRLGEAAVADDVQRMGGDGQQSARELVNPLRAAFEAL